MPEVLTADDARHWALLARAALAARRREIDRLNVFPVPDGDTGTNLYLTMDAAIEDAVAAHERAGVRGRATLVEECRTLSRTVLLAARGNSGVILSQLVAGICGVVCAESAEVIDAALLARGIRRGADLARACVAHPQEGTILTVAEAAAEGAEKAAVDATSVAEVSAAAVAAAVDALERTPEQLPVLAQAGVVDAGGAGAVLLLEALHRAITGTWSATSSALLAAGPPLRRREEWHPARVPVGTLPSPVRSGYAAEPAAARDSARDPIEVDDVPHGEAGGPAYEVMFLLDGSEEERVRALRTALDELGDSLLVVGGPDLWNVHVHVDDVGAALEAGVAAGRPHRIKVTHFASQGQGPTPATKPRVGVVACAAGPGLAALMRDAGAVVVESAPGRRASAGQILDAVLATRALAVLVLPNDRDTALAAEGAARAAQDEGIVTHVLPAGTAVQGLAALAVHDPGRPLHEDVVAMAAAAAATRQGAVTVADREALTWAGVCRPGDVLGVVEGDVVLVGGDVATAGVEVLERLLSAGGELVTVVAGADAGPDVAGRVSEEVRRRHPDVEVVAVRGGQPVYPLLVGVE